MSFLLDTHILLWYLIEPKKLSDEVLDILRDPDNEIYFSAATIQEIAIKKRLGKNDFDYEPKIVADAAKNTVGFIPLNVTVEHSISYYYLPLVEHKDPFDLMLVAQTKYEGMTLITNDDKILTQFNDSSIKLLSNK